MSASRDHGAASAETATAGWRQRVLCLCLGIWLGGLGISAGVVDGADRPNILFIYADDHSPKTISCYEQAYPMAHTPHIDKLAQQGVRFQAAYLGSWCMPSRATLLTGHHPHAIESMRMEGAYPGSEYDPQQCPFWPAEFRKNGYQTAHIGKWHTGTDTGWQRDWDFQVVWNRPKNPENAGKYYGPQITEIHGEEQTVQGYSTDNYTDWACDYIRGEKRETDKPWYLWLCYGAIHGPTIPADRHKGQFADMAAEPPQGIFGPRTGKPSYLDKTQAWSPGENGEPVLTRNPKMTFSRWQQQVNECMQSVDEGVGHLLETLQQTGQLENTLVIYTSDQGFSNGEHGMRQKVAPYEATYSSPLIISQPGKYSGGQYCPQPVNASDLVVTFFAQAGIELPWKMHGRDISPLLDNPQADWDQPMLFTHTGQDYGSSVTRALQRKKEAIHANVPYYVAVRLGTLKYVCYVGAGEPEELYDLKTDPEELTNLATSAEHRSQLARLRQALLAELKRCDADYLVEMCQARQQ